MSYFGGCHYRFAKVLHFMSPTMAQSLIGPVQLSSRTVIGSSIFLIDGKHFDWLEGPNDQYNQDDFHQTDGRVMKMWEKQWQHGNVHLHQWFSCCLQFLHSTSRLHERFLMVVKHALNNWKYTLLIWEISLVKKVPIIIVATYCASPWCAWIIIGANVILFIAFTAEYFGVNPRWKQCIQTLMTLWWLLCHSLKWVNLLFSIKC